LTTFDNDKHFYRGRMMDLSDYRLERGTPDSSWDAFVDRSAQGTLFSQTPFLSVFGDAVAIWYCLKGNDIKAGIALLESKDGKTSYRSGLLVYGGVLFDSFDIKQGIAQIRSEQFRIVSFMAEALAERYSSIAFTTAPSFEDLRPFLWHNYGLDGPKFDVQPRYTSLLAIAPTSPDAPLDDSPLYRACNKSRRQEIRYARRSKVITRDRVDHDLFKDLYLATFAEQGQTVPADEQHAILTSLRRLDEAGKLRMFFAEDDQGNVGSVAAFGIDAKRAYYLFGANDRTIAGRHHTGTAVLWDSFQSLARVGVVEVDLEGVNSPERGYFKLSFGGSLTTYYAVSYQS
jgi:hypothetical protein